MIEALLGAAGGGLTGLIGTGIHAWLRRGEEQRAQAHALAMRKMDLKEMEREAELAMRRVEAEAKVRLQEAQQERLVAQDAAEAQLRTASYQQDRARYGGGLVDAVRGLMRPAITVFLLLQTLAVGWVVWHLLGGLEHLPAEVLLEIQRKLVDALIYLSTTAVVWWFGGRAMRTGGAPR